MIWRLSDGTVVIDSGVVGDSPAANAVRDKFRWAHLGILYVSAAVHPGWVSADLTDPRHINEIVWNVARLHDLEVVEAPKLWMPEPSPLPPGCIA